MQQRHLSCTITGTSRSRDSVTAHAPTSNTSDYFRIMLAARTCLLFAFLCRHNVRKPTSQLVHPANGVNSFLDSRSGCCWYCKYKAKSTSRTGNTTISLWVLAQRFHQRNAYKYFSSRWCPASQYSGLQGSSQVLNNRLLKFIEGLPYTSTHDICGGMNTSQQLNFHLGNFRGIILSMIYERIVT